MPTNSTKVIAALHEVGHALLSLIGSIAVANLPVADSVEMINELTSLYQSGDYEPLRGRVERILRTNNGPQMENVVRHCHELRKKVREYMRIAEG